MGNRIIKFRAFVQNYDGSTEIINDYLTLNEKNKHFEGADLTNDYPCALNVLNVMQFTGLIDKNGVEIYEGDILDVCNGSINGHEWKDKPYTVEYIANKGFDICFFCWNEKGESIMDKTHWCEVIGNIYQNPELINN